MNLYLKFVLFYFSAMKWFLYAVALWCLARLSEEASVRCHDGSQDLECLLQQGVADHSIPKTVYSKSVDSDSLTPHSGDESSDEAECLPGTRWISNCHECQCLSSGIAKCQAMPGCSGKLSEPIRCKPNSTFPRDCNTCICLNNGLGLCTLEPCQRTVKKKSDLPSGHDCAPHTFWKSRCNECGCSPNGYAYCTEMACPDDVDEPLLNCAPDSMWKNECNTCWCTITGYALCTRIGCTLNVNLESSEFKLAGMSESDDSDFEAKSKKAIKHLYSTLYTEPEVYSDDDKSEETDNRIPRRLNIKQGRYNTSEIHGYTDIRNSISKPMPQFSSKHLKYRSGLKMETKSNIKKSSSNANDLSGDESNSDNKNKDDQSIEASDIRPKKYNTDDTQTDHEGYPNKFVNELFNYMRSEMRISDYGESRNDKDQSDVEKMSFRDSDSDESDNDKQLTSSWHKGKMKFKRSVVCKPNEVFQSECNSCKCSQNGESYSCTQSECMDRDMNKEVEVFMESEGVDHIERHSVCKARGTFYIGCNTCHCNIDGTDYSCTNKPCPLPEDVELFHELREMKPIVPLTNAKQENANKTGLKKVENETKSIVCVANRMFIMDCNTCWCNEDGTSYFCTRKVCVPEDIDEDTDKPEELRVIKKECRPDEVFELDCNMCRCNPDGKSFSCTRRACADNTEELGKNGTLSRRIREKELPKACQPGQEFRLDCNKCLCDNEGQDFSCTRIDCTALNNNGGSPRVKREAAREVAVECTAGSVFDHDCNVCRCTADGKHAMCTLNRCSKPEDNDAAPVDSDPSFRCNPGEQFKRGCNDCTCSADGKSTFCTLRLCDQDLTAGM